MNNNSQPWQKYPLISNKLAAVNRIIKENIKTPYASLREALLTMANNGGKYLRPSLLILSAQASTQNQDVSEQIIRLASSIEILHMATLIHDDIIDDSDKRRGNISIQARFGKDTAVYAGDLLFTNFFDLMLSTKLDHHYLVKNARTMRNILNGELGQMAQRFNIEQTLDNYLTNVKGKTAALFCLAAEEGAYFAGAKANLTKTMATFGQNLGIAFQMIDDILDYDGGRELNKPMLEDIATGVYSLPLLLALQHNELKQPLQQLLTKKRKMTTSDIAKIQQIVLKSTALKESHELAKEYTQKALADLKPLPISPAKTLLTKMTQRLLVRTN